MENSYGIMFQLNSTEQNWPRIVWITGISADIFSVLS